ncbi:hypothetical protein LDENG_00106960 [Lucifuga dentata]|nr:hypothetical protein LDENG_00106960 [Lucifuga dentata]
MIVKGQKRKLPPEDVEVLDRSSAAWESQLQFMFSVSLSKYQRGQELPEPSLRRSVLIANTLRHISLEAAGNVPAASMEVPPPPSACNSTPVLQAKEQEGIVTSHRSAVMVENGHPTVTSNQLVTATSRPPTSCLSNASPSPPCVEDEDWESMSTDPDFSLSAAISSILTALDSTIDGGPQATPRTPLRSLENLSGPSEGGMAWSKQGVRGCGGNWERQEECKARESSAEAVRHNYPSDLAVEDLFQDIDTSLLERDMGALGMRGGVGGHPAGDDFLKYLPPFSSSSFPSHPFSISLNQNLKCLPSFSPSSPSSSSLPLTSPSSSGQNLMRDGLELEHLVEILVES